MADFDAKTATPDTSITDDNSILIGADSQSAATPSVYSFGTIKTWIKSWIAKSDVGLGNVTNNAQLAISNNLSDLNDAPTARANLGMLPPMDPDFSTDSQCYLTTPSPSYATGATVAGRLAMIPVWVPRTRTYTTYAISVTGLVAGSAGIRLGLYNADSSLQPTTKIDEGATVIDASTGTGSTGYKTVAFGANQSLKPGLYFIAILTESTPSTTRLGGNVSPAFGVRFVGSAANPNGAKYRDGVTFTTLPSDESGQTYTGQAAGGTSLPLAGIR